MGLLPLIPIFIAIATIALAAANSLALQVHGVAQTRLARYDLIAARFAAGNLQTIGAALQTSGWSASTSATIDPAALTPMLATSLCAARVQCGVSATATYAIDGSTEDPAGATDLVTAPNVESAAHETRTAVTMTVSLVDASGNLLYVRPHRVKLRLYGTNGSEVTAYQDSAGQSATLVSGSAENDGCAVDGSGCDPARIMAEDPTTIDAVDQCEQGIGSGTCATEFPSVSAKVNTTWSNGQVAPDTGP
jgi:hypothetical protein